MLVAQEERIEKFKKDNTVPLSANLAETSISKSSKPTRNTPPTRGNFQNSGGYPNSGGRTNNSRGNFRGGRGRGHSVYANRPQCQVCGKLGHMAWRCYHRFNHQYICPFSST